MTYLLVGAALAGVLVLFTVSCASALYLAMYEDYRREIDND